MNKKTITYTALTIACIGILVLGFFVLFEKVEEEITTPESREARKNRFLAAERFLSLSGVETHSITRRDILVNLPPENELIFINRMGGNLPPEREDSLIAWIERGGSLIITHNSFWNDSTETSRNSFLDRFGIRLMNPYGQEEHSDESPDEPDGTSTETPDPCSEDVVEQVTAGFSNGDSAELEFSTLRILEDA